MMFSALSKSSLVAVDALIGVVDLGLMILMLVALPVLFTNFLRSVEVEMLCCTPIG